MNRRAKGQRNERKAEQFLRSANYEVFRLYQPRYAPQGVLDLIAVGQGRVRFVQVRTNSYHDLRPLKAFHQVLVVDRPFATVEVWLYKDGQKDPTQRVLT